MVHKLKTWPQYFQRVLDREKKFEVRKNDRDYQVGDILELQEYDPEFKEYSQRYICGRVTYILHGPDFGIEKGYCVMSLVIIED